MRACQNAIFFIASGSPCRYSRSIDIRPAVVGSGRVSLARGVGPISPTLIRLEAARPSSHKRPEKVCLRIVCLLGRCMVHGQLTQFRIGLLRSAGRSCEAIPGCGAGLWFLTGPDRSIHNNNAFILHTLSSGCVVSGFCDVRRWIRRISRRLKMIGAPLCHPE